MLTTLINQNLGSLTTCSVRAEAITPEKSRREELAGVEKDGRREGGRKEISVRKRVDMCSFHVLPTALLLRHMRLHLLKMLMMKTMMAVT